MPEGFEPGASLGPYRIVAKIGAGGMGEVYRGRDERLDRDVAIKLLPSEFAKDADRLQRFEQEAKATSALNHPNILTVYDIGEHDSTPYIVSELLEGDELRDVLNEGTIPLRKVTEYSQQIVSGLSAAHEKGIVHRDLKPENIFITSDDRVKILDFGLAKLRAQETDVHGSEDATRRAITDPGVVMGTVGYMSPEQVRGQATDHRSDIFSFGAILHEMITGKRAFQEETMAETMAAIIKQEPEELTVSKPDISPALERLVRRCLEKKPERRFQSTSDLGFALGSVSATTISSRTSLSEIAVEAEASRRSRPLLVYGIGALLLAVGIVAGALGYSYFKKLPMPSFQQITFRRGLITHARFSPDGQTVVYSAEWNGDPGEIFTVHGGLVESQSLGLKDADVLSVSSTGELAILIKRQYRGQLVYKGTLARVPIIGGTPREILEDVQDADWSPDGKELAVVHAVGTKNQLEYPIGKVLYETSGYISDVRISPKGDRIAFMDHKARWDDRGTLATVDTAGTIKVLTDEFSGEDGVAWSPDGGEIWFTASKNGESMGLYAITPSGKIREVLRSPANLMIDDIARDGRVLLTGRQPTSECIGLASGETKERNLTWFEQGGSVDISADGKSFVFNDYGGSTDYSCYLGKTDGSPPVRIGDGYAQIDALSPDGKWVISELASSNRVFALPTGAGQPRPLDFLGIEGRPRNLSWLADSKQIMFVGNEPGKPRRTYVKDLESGAQRAITGEGVTGFLVSPDGRSFICSDNGKISICSVDGNTPPRPVPGLEYKEIITQWTSEGGSLYVFVYEDFTFKIWKLDLTTGRKEPFKEISVADRAGVFFDPGIRITPDGKGYIYDVPRVLMHLYLAEGLK